MPNPIYKNVSSKFLNKSKEAADCIANKSETLGNTIGYKSPFSAQAKKHYLGFEDRGKSDDVTVIVAQIISKDQSNMDKKTVCPNCDKNETFIVDYIQ